MITLLQQKSNLVGDESSINALAKKKNATVLLVSDTHGRSDILCAIIEHFGGGCDVLVFCGDGIGDLCRIFSHIKKSKKLSETFPPVAAFARGNGDYPVFPADFGEGEHDIIVPQHQILKAAGMNMLITHGHSEGAYYGFGRLNQAAMENQADIVFYGHTHIAARQELDLTYFINPGSCSHPRGGQPPSFAIVKIPGGQERAETTFFSIKLSLSEGYEFIPYVPIPYV